MTIVTSDMSCVTPCKVTREHSQLAPGYVTVKGLLIWSMVKTYDFHFEMRVFVLLQFRIIYLIEQLFLSLCSLLR